MFRLLVVSTSLIGLSLAALWGVSHLCPTALALAAHPPSGRFLGLQFDDGNAWVVRSSTSAVAPNSSVTYGGRWVLFKRTSRRVDFSTIEYRPPDESHKTFGRVIHMGPGERRSATHCESRAAFWIPLSAAPFLAFSLAAVGWPHWRRRRRRRLKLCEQCGYDQRANTGSLCPECGKSN